MNKLKSLLIEVSPSFSELQVEKISQYFYLLVEGNKAQNLTRLISEEDFILGHLMDVLELQKSNLVNFPAMDFGSGCGVPGLLFCLIHPSRWFLLESERRKADFLKESVSKLELDKIVDVCWSRAETFLSESKFEIGSIVGRAVGSLKEIYILLRKCSTWNNLILFKGEKWEEEWKEFQSSKFSKELYLVNKKIYSIETNPDVKNLKASHLNLNSKLFKGSNHEKKEGEKIRNRFLVKLARVPRGTI